MTILNAIICGAMTFIAIYQDLQSRFHEARTYICYWLNYKEYVRNNLRAYSSTSLIWQTGIQFELLTDTSVLSNFCFIQRWFQFSEKWKKEMTEVKNGRRKWLKVLAQLKGYEEKENRPNIAYGWRH